MVHVPCTDSWMKALELLSMPAWELVPMHSYTPSSSGNTAPLMVRTEVVIPFVTLVTVPVTRLNSTSGAVGVLVCLLVGMSSPFSLQVKVGVGVPCEVQARVRLPPSMTVLVSDWVVVVIGATERDKGMDSIIYNWTRINSILLHNKWYFTNVVYVNNSQVHVQVTLQQPFVLLVVPGSYGRYRVYRVRLLITACMTYRWLHFIKLSSVLTCLSLRVKTLQVKWVVACADEECCRQNCTITVLKWTYK